MLNRAQWTPHAALWRFPSLSQPGIHSQPLPALQLPRKRTVGQHLSRERDESHHALIAPHFLLTLRGFTATLEAAVSNGILDEVPNNNFVNPSIQSIAV